ncbi:MAG: PQQ-binding-like beta-propeller repeat protein [Pirellulaceae bacterium]
MNNRSTQSPLVQVAMLFGSILLAIAVGSALGQPRGGVLRKRAVKAAVPAAAIAADDADEADGSEQQLDRHFPSGAALKTDPEQQRLLTRAEQCVADGRLDLAAVLWQKVLDEAGDTLMVTRFRPATATGSPLMMYGSLSETVERTLGKLPPEALRTYRIAADGEAQGVLASAGPDREEEALTQVVRRFFLSSHGDDAAYRLACLALDRHDFVGASRLLTKIIERHPDPSMPRGDLLLRLAVASARIGDKSAADESLAKIASAPGSRPASELVALVRQDAAQAVTLASVARGATGRNWHMALGSSARTGHMPALPADATSRTLSELWAEEYPLAMTGAAAANPYGGMPLGGLVVLGGGRVRQQPNQPQAISREDMVAQWRENGWKPTPQLLFDDGKVYIKSPDRLMCYSTQSLGETPVWRSLWSNQYELDGMSQMLAMLAMNMGYGNQLPTNNNPKTSAEVLLFGDRVHQSMSIAGDTIYSLEGKAISEAESKQNARPAKPFQWGVTPRRTRTNWLTAYGAAGGKMKWTRTASDEDKEGGSDVGFLAAPVPCGNLLLVPITDGGTIWLFALSPGDGATVWKSYLCDEPQGGAAPWSPVAIAVDGREAYLTCGCGVIFAVDGVAGSIRWAIRYQRDGKQNNVMRQYGYNAAATLDLSGWDDDVVIPYGQALIVMSSDCDKLLAIDRRTGELLWASPRAEADYCLGVHGRGLFVAGKNVVRRYDIPSGRLVWVKEVEDSLGRGCVTGDAVYLPVKDSIVKFDVEKGGELVQVGVAQTNDDPVGNLFSDGEKLWVAGAGRVYAMTTLEHRLHKLAEQIAAGDPAAQLNRMRLYYKQKQMRLALADLRGAYALFQAQLTPDEAALRLFEAMQELKLSQSQPLVALDLVAELFVTGDSPPTLGKQATQRRSDLLAAAIGSLRQAKTAGSLRRLLSVAPLIEDEYLVLSASQAVDATAGQAQTDLADLRAALAGGQPTAQMISIRALARLAPDEAKNSLATLTVTGDDRVRLAAARALGNLGDRRVLETFVALLESDSSRVRARSHQSLRGLTGQQLDFAPDGKPESRAASASAWRLWVKTEGAKIKLVLPLTEQPVLLGRTLYVSQTQSLLIELDADKKKRWETRLSGPAWGCQGLPNGHRLVAMYAQKLVVEYDSEGNEIWRKEGLPGPPYSVQRLDDGNTLVACADIHKIVEIAPDGTLKQTTVQGRPMSAQRLASGNTLVALQQGNRVVEVDRAGKIVWEARTGNGPAHAVRLENGNTLVCLVNTRQVVEYDASGKNIVWRSTVPLANPYGAQRLPSGNTLVADFQGLHEVDPTGTQVRWQQRQPNITGISSF